MGTRRQDILSERSDVKLNSEKFRNKRKIEGVYDASLVENRTETQVNSKKEEAIRKKIRGIGKLMSRRRESGDENIPFELSLGHSQIELHKLDRLIELKQEIVTNLNTQLMMLQTQKANQDFEKYKIENEYACMKEELRVVSEETDELKQHEQESLKSLQAKYELSCRQAHAVHEQRLEDLKENVTKDVELLISDNIKRSQTERNRLESVCNDLQKQIKFQEQELNRKLIKLKEDHNKKLIQLRTTLDENLSELNENIESLKRESALKAKQHQKLRDEDFNKVTLENESLRYRLSDIRSEFHDKEMELADLRDKIKCMKSASFSIQDEFTAKKDIIQQTNEECDTLKDQLVKQEQQRRILHNKLQELKGNIRVYCRIRPPTTSETKDQLALAHFCLLSELSKDGSEKLCLSNEMISKNENVSLYNSRKQNASHCFLFDKVFLPDLTNEQIFDELSQLIQSSLDGYKVCVFAYGQTGSGKTWTMARPNTGMIPLSINKIFDDIKALSNEGWSYSVEGQFLEIYNETVIDLLATNNLNKTHAIKHDEANHTTSITNLTTFNLTSKEQAESIFEKASLNRSTAFTQSNLRSSRSHSIFILNLRGQNSKTGHKSAGVLNLVDLAGSERLSNSHATGDRLKETQAINRSLSCLGDVIHALGQLQNGATQHHIPFRNSKLTYLLKNSLGGDSKTLMFVNISPYLTNFNESINSLRFATKVNNTKISNK